MRIISLLLVTSFLTACAAATVTDPTDALADTQIGASWVQRDAVAGTKFSFRLTAEGTKLSGSGTYTVEGGRSGTVTVAGTVSDQGVHLDITYDTGEVAQFAGHQVSASELNGGLHLGPAESLTPAGIVTFNRKDTGVPAP